MEWRQINAIIQMDTKRKLENLHQRNKQPFYTLQEAKRIMRETYSAYKLMSRKNVMKKKNNKSTAIITTTHFTAKNERNSNNNTNNHKCNFKKRWGTMECVYCHEIGQSAQYCPAILNNSKNNSAHSALKQRELMTRKKEK